MPRPQALPRGHMLARAVHARLPVQLAAVTAVVLLTVVSGYIIKTGHAAGLTISVDGATQFQTINGLGADINPHSWNNGQLKPALDMLIDQEGMKTFRVGNDMEDWESTNDDSNPNNYNWTYYDPIYSGQTTYDCAQKCVSFADVWAVIDYLHQKGIPDSGIIVSNMGPGASWYGGNTLASGEEDEYAEERPRKPTGATAMVTPSATSHLTTKWIFKPMKVSP